MGNHYDYRSGCTDTSVDDFTAGYITALLFVTHDEELYEKTGNDSSLLDLNYDWNDIDPASQLKIIEHCKEFQEKHESDIAQYSSRAACGADLLFTEEGHGVGYWECDEGPEDVCKRLDAAAKEFSDFCEQVAVYGSEFDPVHVDTTYEKGIVTL